MKKRLVILILALSLCTMATLPGVDAGNHSNAKQKQTEVSKRPPTAGPPDLSDNDDEPGQPGISVRPTSGSARSVSLSVPVDDENGHNDVDSVTITVYKPDNSTVHVSPVSGSKASGTGRQAVYDALFDMEFHDPAGTYHVKIETTDRDGQTDTSWGDFIYEELAAVSFSTSTVSLNPGGDENAAIQPGDDTRDNPSTVTLSNTGNVPIDAELSGTDLDNSDSSASIPVSSIVYSLNETFETETTLSGSTQTLDLDLTAGGSSSKTLYFAADIPTGIPADEYQGTLSLAAVKSV